MRRRLERAEDMEEPVQSRQLRANRYGDHPANGNPVHRVGIVTAYTAGSSITIEAVDGKPYTFVVSPDTKILPESRVDLLVVGARVTIIAPRDVTGGPAAATGIVVHPAASATEEPE